MGQVLSLPLSKETTRYADRMQTVGWHWTGKEKKLLDQAEFLEAMILVLDDVKLQNIQYRDYAMIEIISEEIMRYESRLEEIQKDLALLRLDYQSSPQHLTPM